MRIKITIAAIIFFGLGLACGGYLFSKTLPRDLLPSASCTANCFDGAQIAGLITSTAMMRAPSLIPKVIFESDTCLSIRYPRESHKVHYVLFPKHDVKNIATLTPEDEPYVMGCFAMIRQLVQRDKLQNYFVSTNGPDRQEIAYLHFHLVAN